MYSKSRLTLLNILLSSMGYMLPSSTERCHPTKPMAINIFSRAFIGNSEADHSRVGEFAGVPLCVPWVVPARGQAPL